MTRCSARSVMICPSRGRSCWWRRGLAAADVQKSVEAAHSGQGSRADLDQVNIGMQMTREILCPSCGRYFVREVEV